MKTKPYLILTLTSLLVLPAAAKASADPNETLRELFEGESRRDQLQDVRPTGPLPRVRPAPEDPRDFRFEDDPDRLPRAPMREIREEQRMVLPPLRPDPEDSMERDRRPLPERDRRVRIDERDRRSLTDRERVALIEEWDSRPLTERERRLLLEDMERRELSERERRTIMSEWDRRPLTDRELRVLLADRERRAPSVIGIAAPERPAEEERPEPPAPDKLLREGRLVEVGQVASRARDGQLAVALGWELFQRNRWEEARTWFSRGIQWGADMDEPTYGLALVEYQLGNTRDAITSAREVAGDYRPARVFLQDLLSVGATEAFEVGQYGSSIRLLSELYQYRYLNRSEQMMLAWSYQRTGRHVDAARLFEALYRSNPDQDSADGLNAALVSLGEIEYRNELALQLRGPLERYLETMEEPEYLDRLASRGYIRVIESKVPGENPELRSVNDPVVFAGVTARSKSGQSGLGQLQEVRLPTVGARVFLLERHMVEVQASRVVLTSGTPALDADIGTVPFRGPDDPDPTIFPVSPTTEKSDIELVLRYRWEGLFSPYAEVGFPAGGIGSQLPALRIGATSHYAEGYVEGEFFHLPVRESILSYSGIVDPYTGRNWGRVREYGGRVSVYHQLTDRYSMFGQVEGAYMYGRNVRNNQRLAMRISASRDFEVEGFDFLTIGPGISVANYRRNLGKFTFGHGGYFSPESMFQVDFGANLLTEQGKTWLVAGNAFIGYQTNRQSRTAFFPLDPANDRFYPTEDASSFIFGLSGQAAVLLSPEWMVGGYLSAASTAQYTEYTLGMILQYTFGDRVGLFANDLQGWSSFW